ncbi:hypothetical protein J7M28_02100 [bacterium]|nr:hypothetical protein [bacterium]
MRRYSLLLILALTAILATSVFAEDEEEEAAFSYSLGVTYFAGTWSFEHGDAWSNGITGKYDMDSTWGLAGPTFELSFAEGHIGIGGHYLLGHFDGEYEVRNRRDIGWRQTKEDGSIRARREDIEAFIRFTPWRRYFSLIMGYKWLKHYNFEKRGEGIWQEYLGLEVPVGTYEYETTNSERNRIHGFQFGLALESPHIQGFYAWGNGMMLPILNIKYAQRREFRFKGAGPPDIEDHYCLTGRLESYKMELGIAYSIQNTPLDVKLGWWMQRTKPDDTRTQEAPIWTDKLNGVALSLVYTF